MYRLPACALHPLGARPATRYSSISTLPASGAHCSRLMLALRLPSRYGSGQDRYGGPVGPARPHRSVDCRGEGQDGGGLWKCKPPTRGGRWLDTAPYGIGSLWACKYRETWKTDV